MILIFFLFILIIYSASILGLAISFIFKKQDNFFSDNLNISVLIPFKNEANNLPYLLKSLSFADYPKQKLEFIFIDDNSDDNSKNIITNSNLSFKYKIIKNNDFGKKQALKTGLEHAKREIIIHFDADIEIDKSIFKLISGIFEKTNAKLVFGGVIFKKGKNFFEKLQELEIISLAGIAASSSFLNIPVLISGANLAYKKELKKDFISSINNYNSGDDMFFLQEVKKKHRKKIRFIKNLSTVVKTNPEKNIKSFFNQRIRWAGKTTGIKDFDILLFGFLSFIANILIFVLLYNFKLFLYALIIKFFAEFFSISIFSFFFKKIKLLVLFPVIFIVYPIYIVLIAILSFFLKPVWK